MKKIFLYSVMALFMCLFAACSQEEIVSEGGQGNNKVSLSVKVPGVGPVGRAATDLDVNGYTMHCIMELVDADGNLLSGTSQMKTTVSNGTASFEFDKPSGEYTCLFWAEYLKEGNSFYKTSGGLKAVAYDGNKKNELFNNKAADAFCGKIASTDIAVGTNVTLKRPFARIAIAKEDFNTLGTDLNQCTVSIFSGTDFNVLSGKAGNTVNIKNTEVASVVTPITIDATSEYPFYCYVFSGDAIAKASSITFTKDGESASKKTLSITVEQMKGMGNNTAVNLKPETGGGDDSKINVDITIDNGFGNGGNTPTEPENPAGTVKVGDYLYADGTWGTEATNAVAVVFALAEGDATTNYENVTFKDSKIHGWAVSISQSAKTKWTEEALTAPIAGMTSSNSQDDILGYKNTKAAGNQPAISAYNDWTAVSNTSGWYIPAIGQLAKLIENVATVNAKLVTVTNAEQIPPTGTTSAINYWSSTFNGVADATTKLYQYQYNTEGAFKARAEKSENNAGIIRPIVTF